MGFSIENHEGSFTLKELSEKPLQGKWNGRSANMFVRHPKLYNSLKPRFDELQLLDHPNISMCLGVDYRYGCMFIASEATKFPVSSLTSLGFSYTKQFLSQIVEAIYFMHSKDYIHNALLANSSYLLFDHPFRAKVLIDGCLKSDSPRVGSHTKLTNTSDLATFLKTIFSGGKQGFWNCVPIIRRGRTANKNGVLFDGPRAAAAEYETDLKDFVKKLST
ncbi:hypothetical protein CASFOL_031595 [Castilleja foliolosa]|uniref:Protein kinase domain-containing protein n=1 Tax=Castilleja foliolosa TaxID=1961234 RepID=A0ABD3C5T5_9LAMI